MKLFSAFWVAVTIILSVVFAALFFPLVLGRYGPMQAFLLTMLGLVVIWAVYFVRAVVFSRMAADDAAQSSGRSAHPQG